MWSGDPGGGGGRVGEVGAVLHGVMVAVEAAEVVAKEKRFGLAVDRQPLLLRQRG